MFFYSNVYGKESSYLLYAYAHSYLQMNLRVPLSHQFRIGKEQCSYSLFHTLVDTSQDQKMFCLARQKLGITPFALR